MVNLVKGQRISLTKENAGLSKIRVGLGWDINNLDPTKPFDLDAEAFALNATDKVTSDADFIFYGQPVHPSGAVQHLGDNQTGDGAGDDEVILVDLAKVPDNITKLAFAATVYDGDVRNQNFGQVYNAYIRIVDDITGTEIARFDLTEEYSIETALVAGELYRSGNEWKFNALGTGYTGGLQALGQHYGVNV